MADLVDILLRAQAFGQGHAVLRATHTQVSIQPHARIVCPIEMAGEDTTVHSIAVGGIGQPAQVRAVPDPRHRDDQYGLFEWLAAIMEPYMTACYKAGIFPQVWVPSTAGVGLLDTHCQSDKAGYNGANRRPQRCDASRKLLLVRRRTHVRPVVNTARPTRGSGLVRNGQDRRPSRS